MPQPNRSRGFAKPALRRSKKPAGARGPPLTSPSKIRKSKKEGPGFGSAIIAVVVNDGVNNKRATFTVHRSIITSKAEYFRAALDFPNTNGKVEFNDIDSKHFGPFVQWLYTGNVWSQVVESEAENESNYNDPEWDMLIALYIMGDRFICPDFQNAVITAIIEKEIESDTMPTYAGIVYENTMPGNPLRRLLVDFHVYGYRDVTLAAAAEFDDNPPKEFFQDVVATMLQAGHDLYKNKPVPWVEDPTAYHERNQVFIDLSQSP